MNRKQEGSEASGFGSLQMLRSFSAFTGCLLGSAKLHFDLGLKVPRHMVMVPSICCREGKEGGL